MSRFLSPRVASLAPYTPGEQPVGRAYIKLNANENPYPPSPRVLEAIDQEQLRALRLYSDSRATALHAALAKRFGLAPECVITGNGSDEVLSFAFQAFFTGARGVCYPDVTYSFYPVLAALYGARAVEIPLRPDFTVDVDALCAARGFIALANPNAPTGIALTMADIERILLSDPERLVMVDEAYIGFGTESCAPLCARHDNLLIVGTYSKNRSMAGARLGYALGAPALIRDLNTIKYCFNPYNVNRVTLRAATVATEDETYYAACCARIVRTREDTACKLRKLGFVMTDSQANFLFAKPPCVTAKAYAARLRECGVLIRYFDLPRVSEYVRITIGTSEDMDTLIAHTRDILAANHESLTTDTRIAHTRDTLEGDSL